MVRFVEFDGYGLFDASKPELSVCLFSRQEHAVQSNDANAR